MHRLTTLLVGVALSAGVFAACSSESSSKPSATTTAAGSDTTDAPDTVVDDTMVDDTMVDDTMVDDTSGSGPGTGSDFCNLQIELNEMETPFDDSAATPADYEEFYGNVVPQVLAKEASLAPDELKDEVAKVGEGITALGAALADLDWDVDAAFADPALVDLLSDPAYEEASNAIDAYCGV